MERGINGGADGGHAGLTFFDALGPSRWLTRVALPRQRPARRAELHRQHCPDGHDRSQAVGRLDRNDADTPATFGHIELRALPRLVPQPQKGWRRRLGEAWQALAGETSQLDQARSKAVSAGFSFHKAVSDKGGKHPVCRRFRHCGARGHPREGRRARGREVIKDGNPLAQ